MKKNRCSVCNKRQTPDEIWFWPYRPYLNYIKEREKKNLVILVHPEMSRQDVWGLMNPQWACTAWNLLCDVIWAPQQKCSKEMSNATECFRGHSTAAASFDNWFKKIAEDKLVDNTQAAFSSLFRDVPETMTMLKSPAVTGIWTHNLHGLCIPWNWGHLYFPLLFVLFLLSKLKWHQKWWEMN